MANEVEWTYATQVTLEDSGASAASNVFVAADDDTLEGTGNASYYPLADFVLNAGFTATVAAASIVRLYRQDLNIDGASDAPAPGTACRNLFVGSFIIPTGNSAKTAYPLPDVPLSNDCQFSIENLSDEDLAAGWDLKATPKTFNPGS